MAQNGQQTYEETDLDEIAEERRALAEEREAAKNRAGRLTLQVGKNVIRLMPRRPGERLFHRLFVHYIKNPAMPDKPGRPVACPLKNRNAPCIVCKKVSELRRSGNEMDKAAAKSLSATRRIYANVVDLGAPDKGVQVMEFGVKIYDDILALMDKDDPNSFGDITHPDKGYNIVIEKTVGDPKNPKETTRYNVRPAKSPTAITNRKWLEELRPLAKALEAVTDEQVQKLLEGKTDDMEFPPADEETGTPAGTPADDDEDLYTPPPGKRK